MLWAGFILGFLGSLHCVGMCGPIAFMLPVDRHNNFRKATQVLLYHLGRLISYAILGLVFGVLGKSISLFGIQQQLSIAIGVLMIAAVVVPQKSLNKFKITQPIYRIISKLKSALGQQFKKNRLDTFFTIGFLNGFLPCGLVYMAVFGSIALANPFSSSLYMMLFGLGTMPLMTATVYLGKYINTRIKRRIQSVIPVAVVIIGLLFILRGLGLGIPYLSPADGVSIQKMSATHSCH